MNPSPYKPHSPDANHCILHFRPEGHREPRNKVASLSLAERLVGFKPGTFRFLFKHLNPLGHSPRLRSACGRWREWWLTWLSDCSIDPKLNFSLCFTSCTVNQIAIVCRVNHLLSKKITQALSSFTYEKLFEKFWVCFLN